MEGGGSGGKGDGGVVTAVAVAAAAAAAAENKEVSGGINPGLNGNAPPPFLSKTYDMVDDPATDAIVSWGPESSSFVVWNPPEFSRDLLPKYFKHNNFSSFVRQLNTYGFRKVDPDRWEFANEGFLKGQKNLLKSINRRKPSHAHGPTQKEQPPSQNPSVTACVEVGKFGLEEEVERLKRDKNVLMQELVRLRQQQQSTDHQLETLVERLQGMEQRQQQMMSFLAKAMRSPGFFAQFVQQNDSNRRITEVGKKRRLPKQEGTPDGEILEGQIVKYQPLINEAAKAVLRQILKMNGSPRLESLGNSDNLLLENFQSTSEAFESTSSRNSGVTLSEVPSNSGVSFMPVNSAFSAVCAASGESDQSSGVGTKMIGTDQLTDLGVFPSVPEEIASSPTDINIHKFPELLSIVHEDNVLDISVENLEVPEPQNSYVNPNDSALEEIVPIETDDITDTDVDFYDGEEKLPGIIDSFWEQFLMDSPVSIDVEEVESTTQEAKEVQQITDDLLNNIQPMDHITKQMGLLSSDPKLHGAIYSPPN